MVSDCCMNLQSYVHWVVVISILFWPPCLEKEESGCLALYVLICDLAKHVITWTASSEFGTYRLCEQRRFWRACASAQSRQNLRCSLIQAVSQEEPSDRKPDPWPLWMAGHAQLKFVMTECSKTKNSLDGAHMMSFTFGQYVCIVCLTVDECCLARKQIETYNAHVFKSLKRCILLEIHDARQN